MNYPRFDFDHAALRRLFVTPFLNSFKQFFLYARIDFQHLSSMNGSFYINNDNRVANRATAGRPYKEGGLQTRPYSSALHALCSLPSARSLFVRYTWLLFEKFSPLILGSFQ